MKQKTIACAVACAGLMWAGQGLAQELPLDVRSDRVLAPVQDQIGTSELLERQGPGFAPRVGVLAYCADIAPNAAALGLMSYQRGARSHFHDGGRREGGVVEGSFDRQGQFGAQNLVDMLMYDDGIPRFRDVVLIDGDREQPTSQELLRNFDVVIAYTDKQCGIPIPSGIANQAAQALAQFAQAGKGVVLTGFAFSTEIGFGDAIFRRGLSPLGKGGPGIDSRCSRPGALADPDLGVGQAEGPGPCPIGSCAGLVSPNELTGADGCAPRFPNNDPGRAAECLDAELARCFDPVTGSTDPLFQPHPETDDLACDHMLSLVDGPTISSWATALTEADVDPTATLCFNYDIEGPPLPFLAINADRNIIAVNTFPPDANDINKFWYQCQIANTVQYVGGNRDKCEDRGCNEIKDPFQILP